MHLGLLIGVIELLGCSGGHGAHDRGPPTVRAAAMTWGLQDEVSEAAVVDGAHAFVSVAIVEDVDEAVQLQGVAMLTWAHRPVYGEPGAVRVLSVGVNAVVLDDESLTPHLINTAYTIDQVECAARATSSVYLAADLTKLPADAREKFSAPVLADPNRHYVIRLRPRDALTWGEVAEQDQVEVIVESRDH
ncbi:MAG: hypothetical protein H6825_01700 [Planctomycetes bacterium]|nr:hypothetical protein [Planctomycetota bacterium]